MTFPTTARQFGADTLIDCERRSKVYRAGAAAWYAGPLGEATVGSLTGLCQNRQFLPGKSLTGPETGAGIFGDECPLRDAETGALSRILDQSPGKLKIFPPALGNRIAKARAWIDDIASGCVPSFAEIHCAPAAAQDLVAGQMDIMFESPTITWFVAPTPDGESWQS
jgi:ABC-type amino acid transport substrate-binding protein